MLQYLLRQEPGACSSSPYQARRGPHRQGLSHRGSTPHHSRRSFAVQRTAALTGFSRALPRAGCHRRRVARIHVEDIAHVINYDLPKSPKLHPRVGRTAAPAAWVSRLPVRAGPAYRAVQLERTWNPNREDSPRRQHQGNRSAEPGRVASKVAARPRPDAEVGSTPRRISNANAV